jgi:hypothetical protein
MERRDPIRRRDEDPDLGIAEQLCPWMSHHIS